MGMDEGRRGGLRDAGWDEIGKGMDKGKGGSRELGKHGRSSVN